MKIARLACVSAFALAAFLLLSCSMVTKSGPSAEFMKKQKQLEQELKISLNEVESQNWPEAEKKLKAYLSAHPVSTLSTQARFGLARSLEEQKRYAESITVYQQLIPEARRTARDLAGMAYLRLAACYEALADETRVVSSLENATTLQRHLPLEMRELELPARKAASWLRRKQFEEAKKELARVDRTLPGLFPPEDRSKNEEQGRILYSISQLSLHSLQPDNFLTLLETHERLQNYLWRAIDLKVQPWSSLAEKKLSDNYQTFTKAAAEYTEPSHRKQVETRRLWMGAVLKSLESLKSYAGESWSQVSPEFSKSMQQVESRANGDLWSTQESTPLTPEAKGRNKLKREGRVISEPFFPREKKADPNLQKVEKE